MSPGTLEESMEGPRGPRMILGVPYYNYSFVGPKTLL